MAKLGWPIGLVVALGWIFRRLLSDHGYADRDLVAHYYPLARLRAATLGTGDLFPGWNPLLNGGMPYAADPLNGVFYPPAWLLGVLPDVAVAFTSLVFLHRVLLALFTFRLGRTLGMSGSGAAAAGAVLAIGGTTLSTDALQFLYAYTWIPLYLDQLARFARATQGPGTVGTPGRRSGRFWDGGGAHLAGAAIALLLVLLAGEPQTFYVLVLLTPLWLFATSGRGPAFARADIGRALVVTAAVAASAMALGAVAVWPLGELSSAAHRGVVNDYRAATVWSFHPWRVIDLFLVRPFGVPEPGAWTFWAPPLVRSPFAGFYLKSHYLGAIFAALALAWPWLAESTERRLAFVLSAIAALALLLAMGDYLGLYAVPYRLLPRFNLFRFPERLMIHAVWPLALLAGLAIDGLARARTARPGIRLGVAILGAALVLVAAAAIVPVARIAAASVPDQPQTAAAVIRVTLVAALRRSAWVLGLYGVAVLAFTVWSRRRAGHPGRGAGGTSPRSSGRRPGSPARSNAAVVAPLAALAPLTVLLGLGDLVAAQDRLLRFLPNAVLRVEPPLLAAIGRDAQAEPVARAANQRPPRIYARLQEFDRAIGGSTPATHWQFAAHNVPLGFGVATLTGYNSLELESVVDFARAVPLERVAAILGVHYLTSTPADSAAARFTPIYRQAEPPIVAYRLPSARRPVHLVPRVTFAADPAAARARVAAPEFDPLAETVLLGEGPPMRGGGSGGEVTPIAFGFDRIAVEVQTPDSAAVVLSEVAYPGWTARVNGGPRQPTRVADAVVQAVLVPPGAHQVVFEFRSAAMQRGAILSALAWLALAALGVGQALRGRRPAPAG